MNKLFTKIAGLALGFAMAIGVGAAVSNNSKVTATHAAVSTYAHTFASKPSTGNNVTLSGVSWNISATNLNGYQNGYAGVQFGTSKANGSISLTSSSAFSYSSKTIISEIRVWFNRGGSSVTPSVTIGGVAATSDGTTIAKNSSCSSDYTKATKVTFTPGTTNSGVVVISASSVNAGYICRMEIDVDTPSSFGTLDHIKISTPATKTQYDVGDTFSSDGIVVTAYDGANESTANSKVVTSSVTFSGYNMSTAGQQTVTVSYTEGTTKTTSYNITVNPLPDFVHTYSSNSVFGGTDYSTTDTKTHTPTSGPEYITLGGYNYTGGSTMSLRNTSGMYFGNNEEYKLNSVKKYISKIIITTNADVHSIVQMTEGPTALSEETSITPTLTNSNKTLTYTFSGSNTFFKFKSTSGSYINMESIKVYLGSTVVDAIVDTVSISEPASVFVGKEITLSATVTYTNKDSDNKVTWSVSSGNGGTIDSSTGVFSASSVNETTVVATSVEKDADGHAVTASVKITPLNNRIASVVFDTTNAKKTYNTGDTLDISNITATGTNEAGDEDIELALTASNFSGFDSSEPVTSQTITISYPNEIDPSSPFTTTYTISIVSAPDIDILPADFTTGGYSANDGEHTFDGTKFQSYNVYQNSSAIQFKSNSGYIYNSEAFGMGITSVEISVKESSVAVYLGTTVLTSDTGSQTVSASASDGAKTITPTSNNYGYIRIKAGDNTPKVNYIKIWYAPFTPTVTLDETSFVFTQGESGEIEVNATASHFTDDSSVVFTAHSSDQTILDDSNINSDGGYFLIAQSDVNPGTVTVTVTGTYSDASEEATAEFTITCNAAQRNLLSISITTASSDTIFTVGDEFTITDLVVTGTFDAAPLTADVTAECTFKLWNGSSETALVPGTTTFGDDGDFTIRISHSDSAASETLTYSIRVNAIPKYVETAFDDLYEGAKVLIVSKSDSKAVGAFGSNIYGHENVTFDENGDITAWNNAIEFTVRIYGNRVAFEYGSSKYLGYNGSGNNAHEQVELVGNDNASWTFDDTHGLLSNTTGRYLQYNSGSPRFACYTGSGHDVSIYLNSNSAKTDTLAADTFAYRYLHLRDYVTGDNSCLSTTKGGLGYFDTAATAYASLSSAVKTEFKKNNDAVARFNAWATANGKTINLDTGAVSSARNVSVFNLVQGNNNIAAIIVILSMMSIAAVGGYFFLRKRKED